MSKYAIPTHIFLQMGDWRQPLMMVDRIEDYQYADNGFVKTIKHVTYNDPYIVGHFPDNPIMPGALISEAMGQTSEYLSLLTDICYVINKNEKYKLNTLRDIHNILDDPIFLSVLREQRSRINGVLAGHNIKFKNVVYPGDTVEVTSKLSFSDNNGFKHYSVCAYVGKRPICHGTLINFRNVLK